MAEKREATAYSKAVGDAILGRYKAKRWNQTTLAEKIGARPGTLRRMVAGETEISVRNLQLIATALGTTPQEILDDALEAYGGVERLHAEVAAPSPEELADEKMSVVERENVLTFRKPKTASEFDAYEGDSAAHEYDPDADAPED